MASSRRISVRLLGDASPTCAIGALSIPHEFTIRVREIALGHAQRLLPRDAAIELALQVTKCVPSDREGFDTSPTRPP